MAYMEVDTLVTRYGAYGIVVQNKKLLLTQKKSGPYCGLWGLPGGAIEFGETPEITLKREIKEETAFEANHLELLSVVAHHGKYLKNEKEYQIHHIGIIYRVNSISLIPELIAEEKKAWLPISEIVLEELTPFAKQSLLNGYFQEDHGN